MKKILIAGGSGFLGQALSKFFELKGYQVNILTRNPKSNNEIKWNGHQLGAWTQSLEDSNILINLTGKCVDCRYTKSNKDAILSSRIESTKILEKAIIHSTNKPELWINASSATIYIHAEENQMTESNGIIGDDFSMNVCKKWEKAFLTNEIPYMRKVATRISIVLGNSGGGFPKLKWITKLGLGGHQGNGQQMMSWIHIDDYCRAIEHIIENTYLEGPINLSSPSPISNKLFMAQLRKFLRMPLGIPQSKWMLELGALILRTETELLLKSRNVYPQRLLKSGFIFKHFQLNSALKDLIKKA